MRTFIIWAVVCLIAADGLIGCGGGGGGDTGNRARDISGILLYKSTGIPVSNADITVAGVSTTTDSDGSFFVAAMSDNLGTTFDISSTAFNKITMTTNMSPPDSNDNAPHQHLGTVEVDYVTTYILSGKIFDQAAAPISGCKIILLDTSPQQPAGYATLSKLSTDSDGSGNYSLSGIPGGNVMILFIPPNRLGTIIQRTITSNITYDFAAPDPSYIVNDDFESYATGTAVMNNSVSAPTMSPNNTQYLAVSNSYNFSFSVYSPLVISVDIMNGGSMTFGLSSDYSVIDGFNTLDYTTTGWNHYEQLVFTSPVKILVKWFNGAMSSPTFDNSYSYEYNNFSYSGLMFNKYYSTSTGLDNLQIYH